MGGAALEVNDVVGTVQEVSKLDGIIKEVRGGRLDCCRSATGNLAKSVITWDPKSNLLVTTVAPSRLKPSSC